MQIGGPSISDLIFTLVIYLSHGIRVDLVYNSLDFRKKREGREESRYEKNEEPEIFATGQAPKYARSLGIP
jgi:hypothetical protein